MKLSKKTLIIILTTPILALFLLLVIMLGLGQSADGEINDIVSKLDYKINDYETTALLTADEFVINDYNMLEIYPNFEMSINSITFYASTKYPIEIVLYKYSESSEESIIYEIENGNNKIDIDFDCIYDNLGVFSSRVAIEIKGSCIISKFILKSTTI